MARAATGRRVIVKPRATNGKKGKGQTGPGGVLYRIERLERQVGRLSELVRQHAMDADRLVQIVAENRELLLEELVKKQAAFKEQASALSRNFQRHNGGS